MNAQDLIDELQGTVRGQIARAKEIAALPAERLMLRPAPGQWNVLEVFEHMNLSSGIYVRGLKKVFDMKAASLKPNSIFYPGLLGDYFTKGMQPKPDGTIRNRMKTMRMFDPPRNKGASLRSIDAFIALCEEQLVLLERARSTDLNRMKVTSSLGPIIRFKAGDAFRFPIAHQVRHMLQVERLLA
ncbi:MAG TPA: DinB family protein [Flavobacteriales bacterium]|nr:DinB family protein [Flavobacteriales bacterium]